MSTEVTHGNKRGKCELFSLSLGKKINALAACMLFRCIQNCFLLHWTEIKEAIINALPLLV